MSEAFSRESQDLVGDRGHLVSIGMGAVGVACVVFAALRYGAHVATGRATPWWGNAVGAVAIAALYLWFRRDKTGRSTVAVHGTALIATVALVIPAVYGMGSSKWWLSLVGFSVLLMGRRGEAIVWAVITIVLVPLMALVEHWVVVPNAIGEPRAESAMAGLFYVILLLGITAAFRRVAEQRARALAETLSSLERSNRVRTRFLAHMSHELRTPLHGVIAMTDVARTGEASDAVRDQIETAQHSARALLGLLNNVLDVTRADAGALELDPHPFSLHQTIRDALAPFVAEARDKGVAVVARADPGIDARRIGDDVRVAQIVFNLVGNALKFTERGRIELRLAAAPADPDRVVVSVRDTGRGIAPDKLESIFEPFVQADAGDVRLGGAGLGLSIVRELAHRMGGSARAENGAEGGARFVVELGLPREHPAAPSPGPEDLLGGVHAAELPDATAPGRVLRVLVCEDDPINRKALRAMLGRFGHDVMLAGDGERALELLQSERFDVLLTDIEMPGIDGFELIRRVREREQRDGVPHLPIIATTAHAGEEQRHRLLGVGADEHLPKPFPMAALVAALEVATLPHAQVSGASP